jgi:PAS domain S-box-containing protein
MGLSLPAGTRLHVDAVTAPGDVAPVLVQPKIRVLGQGALPSPQTRSLADIDAGAVDSRWVLTWGVLRPGNRNWNRICFRIFDGNVWALVVIPKADGPAAQRPVGALVRIRGVSGVRLDAKQKRQGAQLFVNRLEDIQVDEAAPQNPFASPPQPIAGLSQAGTHFVLSSHIRGTVIWKMPGRFFVEDRTGATFVETSSPVFAGDTVDVAGFPDSGAYGLTLKDAAVRTAAGRRNSAPARPPRVTPGEVLNGSRKLVRLRARLIGQATNAGEYDLLLAGENQRFSAILPKSSVEQELVSLPHASLLELTGVVIPRRNSQSATALLILVGSPAGIVVLEGTGWMTFKKVLAILGGMGAVVIVALVWVTLLRRTVRRQTATIRARLKNELRLETRYRRLFERNLAGVFRWRPDGRIVDCNQAFAARLRFSSPEELVGSSYWDLDLHPAGQDQLRPALAGEALSKRSAHLRRKDGATVFLLENITPVETHEGTVYETTAIDVTQLRLREEELRRAIDAAEAASRCKSEFPANMSHEIRTPINGIVGMLELALPGCTNCLSAEQRDYMAAIRSSADVLVAVIDGILDFSKIEAGKLQLESVAFNLRDCVASSLRMLRVQARGKPLKMAGRFAADVPECVIGDPVRFSQVIGNLVSNAIKFTERGEIVLTVAMAARERGRAGVPVSVRDTGVGIEPEMRSRIFESFSPADTSTTRRYGGTGLGLAIAARLVELMGGHIHVESEPGAGSTFSFTAWFQLPAASGPEPRAGSGAAAIEPVADGSPTRGRIGEPVRPAVPLHPGRPGMPVLVAEDNPVNRKIATKLLEKLGYSVAVAENGREAVDRWKQGRYRIVFMDIQMPEMDGLEATRLIRQAESEAPVARLPTQILAVTAHALPTGRAKCLDAGMNAHIPKPVTLGSLTAALAQCGAAAGPGIPAQLKHSVRKLAMKRPVVKALPVLVLMATGVWAQLDTASVTGVVRDPSGALVPHASVTLTDLARNFRCRAATDSTGRYLLRALLPGTYSLAVEAPGLAGFRQTDIGLNVTANATVNVELRLAVRGETVHTAPGGAGAPAPVRW